MVGGVVFANLLFSQSILAQDYNNIKKLNDQQIINIKAKALNGDVNKQSALCSLYTYGILGVKKDFREARKWCKMAAENNDFKSEHLLWHSYFSEYRESKNKDLLKLALRYLKLGPDLYINDVKKYNEIIEYITLCYMELNDYQGMKNFFLERSKAGDSESAFALFDLCIIDDVRLKDIKLAKEQLFRAASLGSPYAQFNLGQAYVGVDVGGLDIEKNYSKALNWYKKFLSNKKTDPTSKDALKARHNLAFMYQKGYGTPANVAKALELYRLNCNYGLKADCSAIDKINKKQ